MRNVLFVGDINVDVIMGGLESFPVADREITCESFEVAMGSTAVICACAFAALGGRAAFAGLAGHDDYGEFMLRGLAAFGIDTARVKRTDRVRTGVTVNLIHGTTRTQVTYPGTISEFSAADLDGLRLADFTHVHFAGPYQQTRFRPAITGLLRQAREAGVSTSLDPQWDAGERWAYMDEWLPLLDTFFANDDEAISITGAASPRDACTRLAERTARPVVKTGRDGCLLALDGTVRAVPGRPVEVVDTTGAGDTFDAAFLYALLERGMSLPDAAAFANAAGARSCLFTGGVAARSSYEDVLKFMENNA